MDPWLLSALLFVALFFAVAYGVMRRSDLLDAETALADKDEHLADDGAIISVMREKIAGLEQSLAVANDDAVAQRSVARQKGRELAEARAEITRLKIKPVEPAVIKPGRAQGAAVPKIKSARPKRSAST